MNVEFDFETLYKNERISLKEVFDTISQHIETKDIINKLTENEKYYEENKEKLSEKGKIKAACSICGCEIRKDGLKKHMETHDPNNYGKNGLRIY